MSARLAIYFPGNTKEDEEAKETILRYGVLSVKLLFKDAREVLNFVKLSGDLM